MISVNLTGKVSSDQNDSGSNNSSDNIRLDEKEEIA